MIKKHLKLLILTSVLTLLPILVGILLWDQLPSKIPTHWNFNGEVDGWSSKAVAVFGLPLLMLAVQWIGAFVMLSDPKKQNHSNKMLQLSFWIVPVLGTVLASITYATALGKEIAIEIIVPLFLGLLFVIIGNYLPKCKQNYTVGIKIPWTLSNEENWNKTHRLAGWVFVICGFAIMITGILKLTWLMLILALIMVFVPMVYSFILYRKG